MGTPAERQAALLDSYWSSVGEDPVAPAPERLDPGVAAVARRLQALHAPQPDTALLAAMRAAFEERRAALLRPDGAAQQGRRLRARPTSPPSSWWSFAAAAALLLALAIGRALAPTPLAATRPAVPAPPAVSLAMPAARPTLTAPAAAPRSSVSRSAAGSAFLGVQAITNTPALDARYGLPTRAGAVVVDAVSGGPAARAGLQVKDVITAVDGEPVASVSDLTRLLASRHPGDHVELRVARGTVELRLDVDLGDRPS